MNKYQKEKSREIRDIMRAYKFGKMTYKQAKHKWNEGFRALPLYAITHEASKRGVRTQIRYIPSIDEHECEFTGYTGTGGRFRCGVSVTGIMVRDFRGDRADLVPIVIDRLDREIRELCGYAPLGEKSHMGGL